MKAGFIARLYYQKTRYYLGWFKSADEAAIAYNEKAIELFGEKAKLNAIPPCK